MEIDKKIKELESEISNLREWNDAKAHELMDKDRLIERQTAEMNILRKLTDESKEKLAGINDDFQQQLTRIKANEIELITTFQTTQETMLNSLKAIYEKLIQKTKGETEVPLTALQEFHNEEMDYIKSQVLLLNQRILPLKISTMEIKMPEIPVLTQIVADKPTVKSESLKVPPIASVKADKTVTKPADIKIKRNEPVYLHFVDDSFVRVSKIPEKGISLILDVKERKWIMIWTEDATFVQRRNAERQARSIAHAGYLIDKITRLGQGYTLELLGTSAVPNQLLRDQHNY